MATIASEAAVLPKSVPQPEPGLTPRRMLERARALRPLLRASQAECESGGRVPQAVADALVEGGFFRMVQPRMFGGYEFDLATFYQVVMEIARGCSETGWVTSLVGGHPLLLSRYPAETQMEIYGTHGEVRCPGALTPLGTATRVSGGYRITHSWVSASGCDLGTHFMGLARVEGDEGETLVQLLVDMADCTIEDDWFVMGMRGTGSKRVTVTDLFVPDHRALAVGGMARGAEPLDVNVPLHDNPMYAGLIGPFLIGETAAVAVGAARGALDIYEDLLVTKKSMVPPFRERCHDPVAQQYYGEALSLVLTAEAAMVKSGEDYMAFAQAAQDEGVPFDTAKGLQLTMIAQRCVELSWQAIDLIYRTAGTTASAKQGMPIGRILRNIAVLRTHPVLQRENTGIQLAKLKLLDRAG
ncbi:acyl-CoA dehydrogenase family protein [Novosphingobium jiangmenense]|uniref:Acyl-CoA dehydrogenase family protein n=1 Tax=Novosphingobium jiangmenense TaxID=2791981 RepID=A0ABS0HBB3_9SPHN|nr:acyl-CoA dehydrogenase family protein [Novosphingobium jiangmenense]MBF9149583.1 acyl-CoA dehydrogenase family protein [Novosphingobium jiangmenense]